MTSSRVRLASVMALGIWWWACDSPSPTAPSETGMNFTTLATQPTRAGGAPLVTFLGNATECGEASSSEGFRQVPAETRVLAASSDIEGREVESPNISNRCSAPVQVSFTLEMYASEDRVGTPVLTHVQPTIKLGGQSLADGGCGGCGCGLSMIVYERELGSLPADLNPDVFAFRVTLESDAPIVVNPAGCPPPGIVVDG